jgi:hypothetical protein
MRPRPYGQNMAFQDFLREVIGKAVKCATTKKTRMHYLTEFLLWWREVLIKPSDVDIWERAVWDRTRAVMRDGNWTPEEIIVQKQRDGFTLSEQDLWRWVIYQWRQKWKTRRGKTGANASWTPEARERRSACAEERAEKKITESTEVKNIDTAGGYITPDQVRFIPGPINQEIVELVTGKKLKIPKKSKQ